MEPPLFCLGGGANRRLYSRRLQQLNLPQRPLETARGIKSEIIILTDPATGARRHTFWFRTFRQSGEVIYCGSYSTTRLLDGRACVKVCFPLPDGSATVLMSIAIGEAGELVLTSSGRGYGDPGFYFVLRDAKGRLSGRDTCALCGTGSPSTAPLTRPSQRALRRDHILSAWGLEAVRLHYKMSPKAPGREHLNASAPA